MTKKKVIGDNVKEIKAAIESGKLIEGTDRSLKLLRENKIEKVFVSKNCPGQIKDDIVRLSEFNEIEVVSLSQPNDELGAICRKPYSISMVSISK
jgi:large subunit ribosomal protein L30e